MRVWESVLWLLLTGRHPLSPWQPGRHWIQYCKFKKWSKHCHVPFWQVHRYRYFCRCLVDDFNPLFHLVSSQDVTWHGYHGEIQLTSKHPRGPRSNSQHTNESELHTHLLLKVENTREWSYILPFPYLRSPVPDPISSTLQSGMQPTALAMAWE